ncbi:MAG: hypothetical protein KJ053_02400 [Dehalococcoidia bacterium]|nr:hypothetical protein [Dehalococcoidia bacterium]
MPASSLNPHERRTSFTRHHVPGVPRRQAELLVLFAYGLSNTEAASAMRISEETVHHHSSQARQLVVPPGFEPTRANAQFWALEHKQCCLAAWFLDLDPDATGAKGRLEENGHARGLLRGGPQT